MTSISHVFVFLSQLFMGRVWLLNVIVIDEMYIYICYLGSWRPTAMNILPEPLMLPMRTTSNKLSLKMLRGSMSLHPVSRVLINALLLRFFQSLALCCAIARNFAMYVAGKLVSRLHSITITSLTTIKICPRIFPLCYNYNVRSIFLSAV